MTTITLQRTKAFSEQPRSMIGPVTGNLYVVNALGLVTLDTADQPYFVAQGWTPAYGGTGGVATSGSTTIDFGAFPGSAFAQTTVVAVDAADPNAVVDAWVLPALTADHSIDEHVVDSPQVTAYADGSGNIVITGVPRSGLTSPIPPDPMPYGKWSVAWAFAP